MIWGLYSPSLLSLLLHLLDLEAVSVLCDEYADLYICSSTPFPIFNTIFLLIHWIPSFREGLGFHSCESALALGRAPQTGRRLVLWCVRCAQRSANASLHVLDQARHTEPRMSLRAARPKGPYVVLRRKVAGAIN
jgi:hypothetical protein